MNTHFLKWKESVQSKRILQLVASVFITVTITACGGGGSGGGSADVTNSSPLLPPVGTTVSGAVTKGPVNGASVKFFNIDGFGNVVGNAIATATTDTNGAFSITLPSGTGTVLVESFGGTFIDESDQETAVELKRQIQLSSTQGFRSILSAGSTVVAINPYTDSLVRRARLLASPAGDFLALFNAGKSVLDTTAGFDVLSTIPANPTAPASTATTAQKQYALLLGGLANAVNSISIQAGLAAPTYAVIVAVSLDLVDGSLNGLAFNEPVAIAGTSSGTGNVISAANVNLLTETTRFRNNNNANYTGITVPTIETTQLGNTVPTSNAGLDRSVTSRTLTTLDGSGSTDPDSGLFYSWTQISGVPVQLDDASLVTPSFTSPLTFLTPETLTFSLTVTDPVGATAIDEVIIVVPGAIPRTFFLASGSPIRPSVGLSVGEDFDGGAKVSFNDDGTGSILTDNGLVAITYSQVGESVKIQLPAGTVTDSFEETFDADGDGIFERFLIEEKLDFVEVQLIEDKVNADRLSIRAVGIASFTGIDTTLVIPDTPFDQVEAALALDYAQAKPFNIVGGDKRTLLFNTFAQFPTLFNAKELLIEEFLFNADGTGLTLTNNIAFTWVENTDGHLSTVFANGESAEYFFLESRVTGDVVSTEYTFTTPVEAGANLLVGDARLSFKLDKTDVLGTTTAELAGIYTGLLSFQNQPDLISNIVRLNPDGTGSVEFDFRRQDGNLEFFRSGNNVCWSVAADGTVTVNRQRVNFSPDLYYPDSRVTTPGFCGTQNENELTSKFAYTQYDITGSLYKHFAKQSINTCLGNQDPNCVASFPLGVVGVRIQNRVPFTAVPPLARFDFVAVTSGDPIKSNVLLNDVARDLPIDPTTVTIVNGPFNGTATVDAVTGEISYTPNAGTGQDFLQYRVKDTAGNISTIGKLDITVDGPQAIAANVIAAQRTLVTLDGSQSTDNGAIVSYNWQQISGPPVGLDDPSSATPTFKAPDASGLTVGEVIEFRLQVTDDTGVSGFTNVTVNIDPALTQFFFSFEEFVPPFQFGDEVVEGDFVRLNDDGTGLITNSRADAAPFTWVEVNRVLSIDFSGIGGLVTSEFTFTDFLPDGTPVEVKRTNFIDRFDFKYDDPSLPTGLLLRQEIGRTIELETVTNIVRSETPVNELRRRTVVGVTRSIPITIGNNETRSFVTNSALTFPNLQEAPAPYADELTFNIDGTGTSKFKNVNFTWTLEALGRLNVQFADGESADYFHLKTLNSGDVVGTVYFYADGSHKASVETVLTKDPAVNWDPANIAGIYATEGQTRLTDGSVLSETLFYRIHPDGRGVLELPFTNGDTGVQEGFFNSGFGICWNLDNAGNFTWSRTRSRDQVLPGFSLPSLSHCAALTDDQIFFRRTNRLFDINAQGQLRTVVRNESNACLFSGDPSCDATKLDTVNFFRRIATKIPLTNNPPLPASDFISLDANTSLVIDVLANDLTGDVAIDAGSVFIIQAPRLGTVVIDPVNGNITYTAGSIGGDELFYYRVNDINGNQSTFGEVSVNIVGTIPTASLTFPDTALTNCVSLTGAQLATDITSLNCASSGLVDLTGINQLTALTTLDVSNNALVSADLSQMPALTVVNLSTNSLTLVNVTNNTQLFTLDLSKNFLTAVDVSTNTQLTTLILGQNQLASIDIFNNTLLTTLDLSNNQLTGVSLQNNGALVDVNISGNQISNIGLSSNPQIVNLNLESNILSGLDLTGNTAIVNLNARNNQLSTLNLVSQMQLATLDLSDNLLSSIDLSINTSLTSVILNTNKLTSLFLTNNTALNNLDITKNIGFSCSNIDTIRSEHIGINLLTDENCALVSSLPVPDLNLSACISNTGATFANEVKTLSCPAFGITDTTGINQFTGLQTLDLKQNSIAAIDVSALTLLTNLNIFQNQLTSIDVTKNVLLTSLDLFTNQLTSIDVSNNPLLTLLGLGDNQLGSVSLTTNTLLQNLFLSQNRLLNLNVTPNTALTTLDISDNPGISCTDINLIQSEHPLLSLTFNESCPI